MPIKNVKIVFMQSKCFLYSSLLLIFIRGTCVFECPGNFPDFLPKQEDFNIMNMRSGI